MTRAKRAAPADTAWCGCSAGRGPIRFCPLHEKAPDMRALLDTIRRFYLASPPAAGGDWPFVAAIDAVIPRGAAAAPPWARPADPLESRTVAASEARVARENGGGS